MNCTCCNGEAKRRGFYRNKNFNVQRFECLKCGTTFSEKQPLDNLRVEFQDAVKVVNMLCEGVGIRAISRLTGLHQQTVLNVLARAGSKFGRFFETNVKNIQPEPIQADEMWCFCGCKERMNKTHDQFKGDQWLFLTTGANTKLIVSYAIGKRTPSNTEAVMGDLHNRMNGRFQLTTDGFDAYPVAVRREFGKDIDFAQLIKIYAASKEDGGPERRYSPTVCTGARKIVKIGNPDRDEISTSYVERTNLTVRLFNRRFTRLTLGYSKKFEYLTHAVNLFATYYNFCWVHSAVKMTPAQAAGLTDRKLTIEEILLTPD